MIHLVNSCTSSHWVVSLVLHAVMQMGLSKTRPNHFQDRWCIAHCVGPFEICTILPQKDNLTPIKPDVMFITMFPSLTSWFSHCKEINTNSWIFETGKKSRFTNVKGNITAFQECVSIMKNRRICVKRIKTCKTTSKVHLKKNLPSKMYFWMSLIHFLEVPCNLKIYLNSFINGCSLADKKQETEL